MTKSIVAITRDWKANHALGEDILRTLSECGVTTLYHFGEYGARPDPYGRDWFAERIENLCSKYGVEIWVAPSEADALAWEMSRLIDDAGDKPQPVIPRTGRHQLLFHRREADPAMIKALSLMAERARLGIVNSDGGRLRTRWIDLIV